MIIIFSLECAIAYKYIKPKTRKNVTSSDQYVYNTLQYTLES